MPPLSLTLACHDYDRTRALKDGAVKPGGIEINYLSLPVEETFWRMCQFQEFDASEMSLSAYLIYRSRPNPPFIAIPVFPARQFRHSSVFVNTGAGIERPEDIAGRRVGIPEYAMTAIVWMKGIWQEDYGVRPEDVEWVVGGLEDPGRKERVDISLPPGIRMEEAPEGSTLSECLEEGSIDALFSSRIPLCFQRGSPRVKRIFADARAVEEDYFRRTGIFPMMHTLVVKESIHREHPWVAEELYKAFCRAKSISDEALYDSSALRYSLPWLLTEVEEQRRVMGQDLWPYGLEANRTALEKLIQYSSEQGLIPKPLKVEELFAPSTLSEFKV